MLFCSHAFEIFLLRFSFVVRLNFHVTSFRSTSVVQCLLENYVLLLLFGALLVCVKLRMLLPWAVVTLQVVTLVTRHPAQARVVSERVSKALGSEAN